MTARSLSPGAAAGSGAMVEKPADRDELFAAALRSDRLWFEAGARLTKADGFTLATMPGFEALAPGNTGFLDVWPESDRALDARLNDIEALFRKSNAAWIRFYANAPEAGVFSAMRRAGYRAREETVFAGEHSPGAEPSSLIMIPVRTEQDWKRKLELQRTSDIPSDGHACSPEDWVALERAKCAHSALEFRLFRDKSGIVASMGFMPVSAGIVRFKNLLVRAGARRRGIAREVILLSARSASEIGARYQIQFAIAGTSGERVYRDCGGIALGSVFEFTKAVK